MDLLELKFGSGGGDTSKNRKENMVCVGYGRVSYYRESGLESQ